MITVIISSLPQMLSAHVHFVFFLEVRCASGRCYSLQEGGRTSNVQLASRARMVIRAPSQFGTQREAPTETGEEKLP